MTMQYNVPGGYAQARFVFSVAGLSDSMGFTLGVLAVTMDEEVAATHCAVTFSDTVLDDGAEMLQGWRFDGVHLTTSAPGGYSMTQSLLGVAGTVAGPAIPPNCAMLIRKNTALGGRKNRGRIYMPPAHMREDYTDNAGFINAPTINAYNLRFLAWMDALAAVEIAPYLYHQYDPDAAELPEIPTEITSLTVQPQLATQRLRMR